VTCSVRTDATSVEQQVAERGAERNGLRQCDTGEITLPEAGLVVGDEHDSTDVIAFALHHDHCAATHMRGRRKSTTWQHHDLRTGVLGLGIVHGRVDLGT